MKIGFAVQGSTDEAFLHGLRDRWCKGAELIRSYPRGSTGLSLRRELAKICHELFYLKRCDVLIFLSDADVQDWRELQRSEIAKLPEKIRSFVVYGMADLNIECWLCAEPQFIAQETGQDSSAFQVPDPKTAFESAMGISRDDKKEKEIARMVAHAPLNLWLKNSKSFEDFFDQLWQLSKQCGCQIENLRSRATRSQ